MSDWLTSGRVLDLILAGMALEAVAMAALWRGWRRGIAPGDLLPNLGAGACLLLAMRAGLAGAAAGWVGLPLAVALALHGLDLRRRWRPPAA